MWFRDRRIKGQWVEGWRVTDRLCEGEIGVRDRGEGVVRSSQLLVLNLSVRYLVLAVSPIFLSVRYW